MLAKNTNSTKTFRKVAGKNKWHYSCYIVTLKKAWFLAFEEMCAFFTWKTQMNGNSFDTKSRHA